MLLVLFIVANADSKNAAVITLVRITHGARKHQSVLLLLNLRNSLLRRMINLQLQNQAVIVLVIRIENKIHIAKPGLILSLHIISVTRSQINKINYCGQLCFIII